MHENVCFQLYTNENSFQNIFNNYFTSQLNSLINLIYPSNSEQKQEQVSAPYPS